MKRKDLISIIITTKNEENVIENLLKSIFKQTYKYFEIILVDNNSNDNTLKIAKNFGVKTHIFGPERSAQRNFGARKAKGKYLLFLDADMELSPGVLEDCIRVANEKSFVGVIIPEQSIADNFWGRVKAFERSFYNEGGDSITDAARFFSKKIFLKVKGYDESITGPEDWDLPEKIAKLGLRFGRCKNTIFHNEQHITLLALLNRKYYYGLNAHRYLSKHKIPLIGPKTIYFLRPVFLKQAEKFMEHPILSLGLFYMLFVEQVAGGFGYFMGWLEAK